MQLSQFSIPKTDTRMITHCEKLYKLKIEYHDDKSQTAGKLPCCHLTMQAEVEKLIKAILYLLPNQTTMKIQTRHFYAEYSLVPWPALGKVQFWKDRKPIQTFSQVIHLVLAPKLASSSETDEPESLIHVSEKMESDQKRLRSKRRRLPPNSSQSKTQGQNESEDGRHQTNTSKGTSRKLIYQTVESSTDKTVRSSRKSPAKKTKKHDPASHSTFANKKQLKNLRHSPARNGLAQDEESEVHDRDARNTCYQSLDFLNDWEGASGDDKGHHQTNPVTSARRRPLHVQSHQRDKTLIELDDRIEDMKLRLLSQSETPTTKVTRQSKRTYSQIGDQSNSFVDSFITPIKKLFWKN